MAGPGWTTLNHETKHSSDKCCLHWRTKFAQFILRGRLLEQILGRTFDQTDNYSGPVTVRVRVRGGKSDLIS